MDARQVGAVPARRDDGEEAAPPREPRVLSSTAARDALLIFLERREIGFATQLLDERP